MSFYRAPPRFDPSSAEAEQYSLSDFPEDVDFNDPSSFFPALGHGGVGGPRIPTLLSPPQVRKEASLRSLRIWKNWEYLNRILERHEATIQRRWRKKSVQARREIILSAWPNMPISHRPDFEAFTRESLAQRAQGTKFKDAYMWPYINQEDLCSPRALLLLINARGRTTPGAFTLADWNAAHLGYITHALQPGFLNQYTMMFLGRNGPKRYGELIAWDDHPDAFDWMVSRKGCLPGQGLDILEIQDRIWEFSVQCCKQILHDIPEDSLLDTKYPLQPEPPSVSEHKSGNASLAVLAAEAPYRPPANLDLSRIKALLGAKLTAAEDHIWALREDPGYFSDTVISYKEHRQEIILDTEGQKHPTLKPATLRIFWSRVLGEVIANAYMYVEVWNDLHEQAAILEALQKKFAPRISIENDLPEEYLDALLKFKLYIEQATNGPIEILKRSVVASPEMRRYFVREPQQPGTTKMQVRSKSSASTDKIQGRLMWLLGAMWDKDTTLFCGIENLVDETERLVQSEKQAKELISPYVASVFSDLSLLAECLRQIKTYQPWAETFENRMVSKEEGIKTEYIEHTEPRVAFLGGFEGTSISSLGTPDGKRFYYPVEKRATKENTDAMIEAEKNLDLFWEEVDLHMLKQNRTKLEHTLSFKLLSESRTLQRTPEWKEPKKENRQSEVGHEAEILLEPLSKIYLDVEQRTKNTIEPDQQTQKKAKVKTRGIARSENQPAIAQAPNQHLPDKQPTIIVDKKAYNVFSILFYKPSSSSQPGEIHWLDFCHAMRSADFAIEKLYGSVWHFQPLKLDVERGISFHEPHPSSKLPFRTARRFGRRLNRAYGWHGAMFVLKAS